MPRITVENEPTMESPSAPAVRKLGEHHYELPCRVCGETAVVMRVAVRGTAWGDEPRPHLVYRGITHEPLPGLHIAHSEPVFRWLEAADLAAVHEYLMKVDVRMDGGLDAYCPECDAIYCATHYHTRVEFDDEFAGFYDCTTGTCPRGHTRILDD